MCLATTFRLVKCGLITAAPVMPRVGKLCLRMVPRLVSVELSSAPTAEPLGFTTKARPDSRVGDLLPGLCSAVGRAIEETALVFGDKRLRNKVTLARSGIQGSAQIGVLSVPPSHRCPSCGAGGASQESLGAQPGQPGQPGVPVTPLLDQPRLSGEGGWREQQGAAGLAHDTPTCSGRAVK